MINFIWRRYIWK